MARVLPNSKLNRQKLSVEDSYDRVQARKDGLNDYNATPIVPTTRNAFGKNRPAKDFKEGGQKPNAD